MGRSCTAAVKSWMGNACIVYTTGGRKRNTQNTKLYTIKKLKEKYSLETSVTIVIEMEKGNGPEDAQQ